MDFNIPAFSQIWARLFYYWLTGYVSRPLSFTDSDNRTASLGPSGNSTAYYVIYPTEVLELNPPAVCLQHDGAILQHVQ